MFRACSLLTLMLLCAPGAQAQISFRDAADRDAFRRWFVLLVDAQFYRATPDVTDCAALVRHAVREALRSQAPDWIRQAAIPGGVVAPAVRATAVEREGALLLFRVNARRPPDHAEFADAKTLIRLNARPMGRGLSVIRPGDLLYFRQPGQRLPDHLMVYVGRSPFEREGNDWVVYHTGPSAPGPGTAADPGEVRKARLGDLRRHPAPQWRPVPANPAFVGVFRLAVLGS